MASKATRKIQGAGWSDESVKTGGRNFLDRYRAAEGCQDRIRVMPVPGVDLPAVIFVHYDHARRMFFNCTGDADTCPACEAGLEEAKPKYAVPIALIERNEVKKKKIEAPGKIMRWIFGGDKYVTFRDLIVPGLKSPDDLYKRDMLIGCQDEQFQRVSMMLCEGKSKLQRATAKEWKETGLDEFKQWLLTEFEPDAIREHLKRAKAGRAGGGRSSGSGGGTAAPDLSSLDDDDDIDSLDDDLDDVLGDLA